MKHLFTAVIIALLIGSIGCEEESSNPTDSNNNTQAAPVVPQITFNGPNTTSQDPNAQIANSYATIMNSSMALSAALSSAPVQQNGNTYTWTYTAGGETLTFTCTRQSDGSYTWILKYSGIYAGTAVTDFTMWEGTTSADGKTGSWTFYTPGHAGKTGEFVYTTDANNVITGTQYLYGSGGTLSSKMIIVNNPDGSGSIEVYDDGVTLNYKSVWAVDGSGTWYTYPGGVETVGGTWV